MLNYNMVVRMVTALIEAGIHEKYQKVEFDAELVQYHELLVKIKDLKK